MSETWTWEDRERLRREIIETGDSKMFERMLYSDAYSPRRGPDPFWAPLTGEQRAGQKAWDREVSEERAAIKARWAKADGASSDPTKVRTPK